MFCSVFDGEWSYLRSTISNHACQGRRRRRRRRRRCCNMVATNTFIFQPYFLKWAEALQIPIALKDSFKITFIAKKENICKTINPLKFLTEKSRRLK